MMYDVRWGGALFSYNLQGSKGEGIGARKWRKDKKVLKSAQKTKKNLDKCAKFCNKRSLW